MKLFYSNGLIWLMSAFALCGKVSAQTTNMQLPSQVGVYNPTMRTSQMQLPSQVGVYNPTVGNARLPAQGGNSSYAVRQGTMSGGMYNSAYAKRPIVDYKKQPVMNDTLYENVNGYKTPNRYSLQNASMKQLSNDTSKTTLDAEFGTEYYLGIGYGKGTFDGVGIEYKGDKNYPPMNQISEGLGDPRILSLGFGVMNNRTVRVEVNYLNLSGLKYDGISYTEGQWCGPTDLDTVGFFYDCNDENSVRGGGVSSNALMVNAYLAFTDVVDDLFGDFIVPYVGAGVGMAFNKLNDYTIYDEWGDGEVPLDTSGAPSDSNGNNLAGSYTYSGDITHFGMSTTNVAWNIEAGLTFRLDNKTLFDVYYKMGNYGKVKSNDMIFYSYGVVDIVDATTAENSTTDGSYKGYCTTAALDEGFDYNEETGWCEADAGTEEGYSDGFVESGKIETKEIGVKLRMVF